MRNAWHVPRPLALALLGVLALCLSAAQRAATAEQEQAGQGRWIFKYDLSKREPAPELKTPPRYLGTLTSVEERRDGKWSAQVKLDDLRQGQQIIYVTEDTKVDGRPAKERVKLLKEKTPIAVYGEEKEGRFYAKSIFVVPAKDWQAILEAKQAEEERAKQQGAQPTEGPPATEPTPPAGTAPAEGPPTTGQAAPPNVGLSEEELGVPKEGSQPPGTPSEQPPPAGPEQRGDLRVTIKTVRAQGAEMSVVSKGKVILVTTNAQTTILEGEKKLQPSELKDGWTVDVEVGTWRGHGNCTAKRIWVVKRQPEPQPQPHQ